MSEILIVAKELPCSYSAIISCLKGFRFVFAFRGRPTFCISLGSYVPIYILKPRLTSTGPNSPQPHYLRSLGGADLDVVGIEEPDREIVI
jgi:hypothetical protein